jgi:hypothetical protein
MINKLLPWGFGNINHPKEVNSKINIIIIAHSAFLNAYNIKHICEWYELVEVFYTSTLG